jgi:hypothetical protein
MSDYSNTIALLAGRFRTAWTPNNTKISMALRNGHYISQRPIATTVVEQWAAEQAYDLAWEVREEMVDDVLKLANSTPWQA